VQPKRSLIRIVRNQDGVKVDPTGRVSGRGAYIHSQRRCWQNALRGPLSKALKTEIAPDDLNHLITYMLTLPDEASTNNKQLGILDESSSSN
jgi:predicted RNA-binding protein YlxR (DUF448 family)